MATSGGSRGSTTTAEASRKFYSDPEMRERLVLLCPEGKRDVLRQILTNGKDIGRKNKFELMGEC